MLTFVPNKKYTAQEYLCFEEKAFEKHEFHDGKIKRRKTVGHIENEINVKASCAIWQAAKKTATKYRVYMSNMKIRIPEHNAFVYPDAFVISEKPELWEDRKDVIVNPLLIVEVEPSSIEGYDREVKFEMYRTLPLCKEYLLISPTMPVVLQYFREEKDFWRTTIHSGLRCKIPLRSLHCEIALSDIYKDIEFEEKQKA